jgi:hypothetical protein
MEGVEPSYNRVKVYRRNHLATFHFRFQKAGQGGIRTPGTVVRSHIL